MTELRRCGCWLLIALLTGCARPPKSASGEAPLPPLRLSGWPEGATLPESWTCRGGESRPAVSWDAVSRAQSYALIFEDPDAPGGVWYHWVAWNLTAPRLVGGQGPEAGQPQMRQGTNSWGRKGYGGPCPPSGEHRYVLHLWALDAPLELPDATTAPELRAALQDHALAHGSLLGRVAARP